MLEALAVSIMAAVTNATLNHFFAVLRDNAATFDKKRTEFIATIEAHQFGNTSSALYVEQHFAACVAALQAFRSCIPAEHIDAYQQACAEYYAACEPHMGAGLLTCLAVDLNAGALDARHSIIASLENIIAVAKAV